ncbi:hypothetical protein DFH08DRAFT_721781 [Mycena albidolilacea]|uniref:Helitron helicase-like domain-containing protein n=1 Tax=Mycena albidolilacea TaxID=1033008 RepID=A0AAD6Z2K9_9AGAR|nr:hypothetical protein DFH08DRAFT_721781 [Mycena albidolilacea]
MHVTHLVFACLTGCPQCHLSRQVDGTFQKDPNFAYMHWNIIQKAEVNQQISFHTPVRQQAGIVANIQEMVPVIVELIHKWEFSPNAKPSNKYEKKAMCTLSKLKVLTRDLKGSSSYKQCRCNQTCELIKKLSTPALFLTLNPADVAHPLLGAMAGVVPDEWKSWKSFKRCKFITDNPSPAAIFFDEVIKAFIHIILYYDPSAVSSESNSLFRRCNPYYTMVEAQGRGTLYCHLD